MNVELQFEIVETIKSIKFHKNGKVKKEKYFNGTIVEYDDRGNEIHYKGGSFGIESWREYDEKGNEIYYKVNDKVIFDRRTNKGE